MSDLIFAIDLETTGLDPHADDILEIALVPVHLPEFRIGPSAIVKQIALTENGKRRLAANDYVTQMHARSGLLDDVSASSATVEQVERMILAYLDGAIGVGQSAGPMFGVNPEFDRKFLEVHMPDLARRFHYRALDVNAFHIFRCAIEGRWADATRSKGGAAHRALADCEAAVQAVHSFADWFHDCGAK